MRNIRVFVVLLLLAIATPVAIRYRAWSLGAPATDAALVATAQSSNIQLGSNPVKSRETRIPAAKTDSDESSGSRSSQSSLAALDLPSGSSSLPLLSVIGFGIFLGGLISALRTRPAHK
jgi:hypothetical protein